MTPSKVPLLIKQLSYSVQAHDECVRKRYTLMDVAVLCCSIRMSNISEQVSLAYPITTVGSAAWIIQAIEFQEWLGGERLKASRSAVAIGNGVSHHKGFFR